LSQFQAPRTMILLDPAMELNRPPRTNAAKRRVASGATRSLFLPSTRSLSGFLVQAQAAVRLRGQVTVLLTGDAALRALNRRFRRKNKPTDVLSFPAAAFKNAKPAQRIAGDLAISVETARRQAEARGHSLATEIKILILHGLLHLAGYDHEADSGQMNRRERHLRARLRLPHGLIERETLPKSGSSAGGLQ